MRRILAGLALFAIVVGCTTLEKPDLLKSKKEKEREEILEDLKAHFTGSNIKSNEVPIFQDAPGIGK